jgi:predicted nucleotide-binding protein (sugar kinase/HSP70/actin superfamily)
MLKVTFPHIGNSYIPFRTLLTEVGMEPVIPPPITPQTIELGTKMAPEFVCYPLKVNLGNYVEAIEAGAELILMAGGVGPCRFGYYGEQQREILEEAGYHVNFLVLEAPKTHPMELWNKIKHYIPKHRIADLSKAIRLAWLKASALDRFDRVANQIRAMESCSGSVTKLQKKFYRNLDQVYSVRDIKIISNDYISELQSLPVKQNYFPLKIVLLGEIYMVLEPSVNFEMERILGEMGVLVERTIYFTDWVRDHLIYSIIHPNWNQKLKSMAYPYLQNFVGGHGLETVALTVQAGINRYDGVIELAPFTCMPEIIAMQVLPTVSRELAIPVLNIIIDEHSGEAGILTRLEAFIDILRYQRKKHTCVGNGGKNLAALSGN